MAAIIHVFLVVAASTVWLWRSGIAGQRLKETRWERLTLDPPYIYVNPTSHKTGHSVTLNCSYIDDSHTPPFFQLRKSVNGNMTTVVLVEVTKPDVIEGNLFDRQEREVSGSFESKYVAVSFKKPTCENESLYSCISMHPSVSDPYHYVNTKALLYLSVNGPVTMAVFPEGRSSWKVDDEVTLNCTGPAPKNRTHTKNWKIDFVWEFRDPGTDAWCPVSSSTVNLTYDATVPFFDDNSEMYCGCTVSEVKKFRLREQDLEREFRCHMVVNDDSYLRYNASVILGTDGGDDKGGGDNAGGDKGGGDKGGDNKWGDNKGGDDKGGDDKGGDDKGGDDKGGDDNGGDDKGGDDNGGDDKGGDDKRGDDKGGDLKRIQSKSDGLWSPAVIGGLSGGGLLVLGGLACFLMRRPNQQQADTAPTQGPSTDTDHGNASYHTSVNDPEPDETAGSDVSVSTTSETSDLTSEEPSTYTSGSTSGWFS